MRIWNALLVTAAVFGFAPAHAQTFPNRAITLVIPFAPGGSTSIVGRVIADKMMVCGAHFPFPGAGSFAKDGDAYAFTPVES